MSSKVEYWTDAVAKRLRDRLSDADLPLLPKQVRIHEETDSLGEDGWRLVLVLHAPEGQTWDRQQVFSTRRKSVEIFDEMAATDGRGLPGATIASVTTDEARELDVAPVDEPLEGEDPGRTP